MTCALALSRLNVARDENVAKNIEVIGASTICLGNVIRAMPPIAV